MEIDKYIGKAVLFNCKADFIQENQWLLQRHSKSPLFYAKVVAVDSMGAWVENPKLEIMSEHDAEPAFHKVNILIPWHSIVSIAIFPEREFPSHELISGQESTPLGFQPPT